MSNELLLLSAILFTLSYFPALRMMQALVSPYPKAGLTRRAWGAAVDGLLVITCWVAYQQSGFAGFAAGGAGYVLFRDAIRGQSIGKLIVGQRVIRIDSGLPCRFTESVVRNAIFVLPGANIAAVFLEARTLSRDPQGQRLGDRLASTQVVEGLAARDIVRALQKWWQQFLAEVPTGAGRKERLPGLDGRIRMVCLLPSRSSNV